MSDQPCPFCPDNWDNLDIVEEPVDGYAVLNPLDPVTPGHVLVICAEHTRDAAEDPHITSDLMLVAAEYIRRQGIQANIITSIGPLATQTVMHTHVHVVPRRENDGLPLPWTPQHELKMLRAIQAAQLVQQESSFSPSVGLFQQPRRTAFLDTLDARALDAREGLGYD